jgi:hypothetical protein
MNEAQTFLAFFDPGSGVSTWEALTAAVIILLLSLKQPQNFILSRSRKFFGRKKQK